VTLDASAASGHEFTGWSGACQGTATPCTVTLAGARYVAAHFRMIPPMVMSFYHLDTLGSVRAVTNATGGEVRRDDYQAFGEAGTPPQGDSIRFTGKERDAETALDYFGARYYRNLTGRFTTVDPDHVGGDIFDPQSWNAYAYARNNPLRFVDPTGRAFQNFCPPGQYCERVQVTAKKLPNILDALEDVNTMAGWLGFSDVVLHAGKRAAWLMSGAVLGRLTVISGDVMLATRLGAVIFKTGHYAQRLIAAGVDVGRAEAAVQAAIKAGGPLVNEIIVDGVKLRYIAEARPGGLISVGTIHLLK